MKFEFIDHNVSYTMNIFLIIANIINLFYNIPQIITTYKRKSTRDFSTWFLLLRFIGNLIWVAYAVEINSFLMLINNIVTVLSSAFIGYYKIIEIIFDYREKKLKNFIINLENNVESNELFDLLDNNNDNDKTNENDNQSKSTMFEVELNTHNNITNYEN